MIYSNNYFLKEFRQKYGNAKISLNYLFLLGMFLGFMAFSIHFVLQTVTESVLTIKFPQYMSQSFHTVLYTYLSVSNLFFLIYFLIHYKYITFYEIHGNRWYLLKQLGHSIFMMVASKISVTILSVIIIYTTGFLTTILLTIFLDYTFIVNYFIPMYLVGCINVLFIAVVVTLGSLRLVDKKTVKSDVFTIGVLLYLLQWVTNYYPLVRNRVQMQQVRSLFQWHLSSYAVIAIGVILISLIGIIVVTLCTATKYHFKSNNRRKRYLNRSLELIIYSFLTLFIILCGAIQIIILSVSFASREREITIRGMIPYVFQSTTMEPTIYKNDLAYFQQSDVQDELTIGDIVLFREDSRIFVERIIAIEDDYVTVDIDKYPKDSKEGIMIKSIPRKQIYAKYISSSRYLGALILFANTMFGRLIFLVLPSVLLFFHKPIKKQIHSILLMES